MRPALRLNRPISAFTSMSLDIFWFLPTSGDTRYLGTSDFGRAPTN